MKSEGTYSLPKVMSELLSNVTHCRLNNKVKYVPDQIIK